MDKTHRPFVYSLSPCGATLESAQAVAGVADMYRITGDWHDCVPASEGGANWNCTGRPSWGPPGLATHFVAAHTVETMIGQPSFPDLDMLTPYHNASNDPAFRLQMTLWAITRSPLFYGGDLRSTELRAEDFKLLTNREVLAVSDSSSHNRQVLARPADGVYAWAASASLDSGGGLYVALFNTGAVTRRVSVGFSELGISAKAVCAVQDLWTHEPRGNATGKAAATLPATTGAELWRLRCGNQQQ